MKNGNGNFVIVITETAVVIEHLVDTNPWDVAKKILAGHNTSLVEVVTFPEADGLPGICGLIAEEGKIENLYVNMVASAFFHKAFRSELDFNDFIAGPMVICLNDASLSGLPFTQEYLCLALQLLGDFFRAKDFESSTSESV